MEFISCHIIPLVTNSLKGGHTHHIHTCTHTHTHTHTHMHSDFADKKHFKKPGVKTSVYIYPTLAGVFAYIFSQSRD